MSVRRVMMGVAALAAAALWVLPAAAGQIASFNIRGWSLSAQSHSETGAFSSCIATADYRSGMTLGFLIGADYDWSLAVLDTPFKLRKGQRIDVAYQVDGGMVHKGQGRAAEADFVILPLPDERNLFEEFRRGSLLRVSIAGKITGFRLDGTSAMLAALLQCVNRYKDYQGSPPAVSTRRDRDTKPETPKAESATGSGFFVSADGAALTNAHVVDGCQDATITGFGPARIVARDTANDLALLKLGGGTATTPARFRRKPVQLGEQAYALGFPLAGQLDNGLNFTSGIVSSLAGPGNDTRALQITAPIQNGNSGGPILDGSGLVIGVTQAKLSEVAAIKSGGAFPQNVNFGIKADLAANFLRANAIDPKDVETAETQPTVTVARDGKDFTIQVKCVPKS